MRLLGYNAHGTDARLHSMFTSSLTEETKAIRDDIAVVSEKVDDPVLCDKVKQYVYAPRDIQNLYKADAGEQTDRAKQFSILPSNRSR